MDEPDDDDADPDITASTVPHATARSAPDRVGRDVPYVLCTDLGVYVVPGRDARLLDAAPMPMEGQRITMLVTQRSQELWRTEVRQGTVRGTRRHGPSGRCIVVDNPGRTRRWVIRASRIHGWRFGWDTSAVIVLAALAPPAGNASGLPGAPSRERTPLVAVADETSHRPPGGQAPTADRQVSLDSLVSLYNELVDEHRARREQVGRLRSYRRDRDLDDDANFSFLLGTLAGHGTALAALFAYITAMELDSLGRFGIADLLRTEPQDLDR